MKAITIKQPWASLIVHGIKDIENRTWSCPKKYLGQRVLIHSSGKPLNYDNFYDSILTNEQLLALPENKEWKDFSFCTGSIIGSVEIIDCVQNHPSIWAEKGVYNWVLANPILYENPIKDVKKANISDGAYIFEYELTDIYGLKRRGTAVKANAGGGNIRFE